MESPRPRSHPDVALHPLLSPDTLDREAVALYESATWQRVVTDWTEAPAPIATPTPAHPLSPSSPPSRRPSTRRVRRAGESCSPCRWTGWSPRRSTRFRRPRPASSRLPGRIGAVLPDRLHAWRRIGRAGLRPSVHLGYARLVLTEWGWQNAPYKLRDARGARCVCGALLAAHRLGYGSATTMNEAAAWIMTELRSRGWGELIGPWNRAPGRTAADAVELLDATILRAAQAGH